MYLAHSRGFLSFVESLVRIEFPVLGIGSGSALKPDKYSLCGLGPEGAGPALGHTEVSGVPELLERTVTAWRTRHCSQREAEPVGLHPTVQRGKLSLGETWGLVPTSQLIH